MVAWYAVRIGGAFPFPGGWTLAILLMANLLAAHLVRFKLSAKRAGILILHAGLIVTPTGEIVTGVYAVEGNMAIEEGETVNVVVDNRVCELAIVDPSERQDRPRDFGAALDAATSSRPDSRRTTTV
jgi:cytochrome c biogenesis factor